MKVFVLMYYNYDETNYFGVFSSKEKAEEKMDILVKEGWYNKFFYIEEDDVQ